MCLIARLIVMFSIAVAIGNLSESRLIHIYHKLDTDNGQAPKLVGSVNGLDQKSQVPLFPPSSMVPQSSIANLSTPSTKDTTAQPEEAETNIGIAAARATIDLRSPIKRIRDLIGRHQAPVIVLSESSESTNDRSPPSVAKTEALEQRFTGSSLAPGTADQQQQQQQEHWTIVDTNQIGVMQPVQSTYQQARQAQQQILQSTFPMSTNLIGSQGNNVGAQQQHYFTFAPAGQSVPDSLMSQFVVQPTGSGSQLAFPQLMPQFAASYQPQQQQQLTQSSQNLQHQATLDAAQPVFLSSYVPELPVNSMNPFLTGGNVLPQQSGAISQPQTSSPGQPNSIQSQIQAADRDNDSEAKRANDNDGDVADNAGGAEDSDGDRPDPEKGPAANPDGPAGEQDDVEPSEGSVSDEGSPRRAASGSLSYEDKYDSDSDSAPQHQPSSRSTKFRAEPSGQVINGLVNVGLNDDCLQCICRAASGCDHLLRCITRGAEEKFCGPFQLTEEYWNKAGSPGDQATNFVSFEDCANDADCAVETVTNYMKKYLRDCDGDENITCMDYARLHRLKPDQCDQTDKLMNDYDAYWAKFQRCAEGYNRTRTGEDEDI